MKRQPDKYEELGYDLWKKFNGALEAAGFNVYIHNNAQEGRGSVAFHKDTFVPIIDFNYWYYGRPTLDRGFISIHVVDRNGDNILNVGNTVAVYICDIMPDGAFEEMEPRFDKMLETAMKNYSCYNRENRLDSVFKNLEQDRQKF